RRMAEIGRDHGLDTLIAPVRPTLKHVYPLTPMESYIGWGRPAGTHFDPWLRTHERLGAEIVKVAPQSCTVPASVAEWGEWAQMKFPPTGDQGMYVEPNVWMVHPGRLPRAPASVLPPDAGRASRPGARRRRLRLRR